MARLSEFVWTPKGLQDLFNEVQEDHLRALDECQRDWPDAFRMRTLIRTAISTMEASVFMARKHALACGLELTPEERKWLETGEAQKPPKGQVPDPFGTKLSDDVARLFALFGPLGLSADLDTDEWMQFRRAVLLRNRLTHPSSVESLRFSPVEFKNVLDGTAWVMQRLTEIVRLVGDRLPKS